MVKYYIPDRGDVIWLDFQPTRGHEQSGRRPALVLSPKKYNRLIGLAIVCPITSQKKGYNFEVTTTIENRESVVLSDHVRSIAWKRRRPSFIMKADINTVAQVLEN